jgi:hypothetical protein
VYSPKLLLPGYWLRSGSSLERALLVKFMQRTYQELYPDQDFSHLVQTVEHYLTYESPVWWVEPEELDPIASTALLSRATLSPVACLWLGNSVDQVTGNRHACMRSLGLGRGAIASWDCKSFKPINLPSICTKS